MKVGDIFQQQHQNLRSNRSLRVMYTLCDELHNQFALLTGTPKSSATIIHCQPPLRACKQGDESPAPSPCSAEECENVSDTALDGGRCHLPLRDLQKVQVTYQSNHFISYARKLAHFPHTHTHTHTHLLQCTM